MKTDNLAKNTVMLAVGTFLNKGLQFIMVPFFSRWISVEEFGKFDLFVTYVTLLIPIVTLACSDAVFRFGIDEEGIQAKGNYITNGLAVVVTNLVICALAIMGIGYFGKWELALPFMLMAVAEIFNNYLQGYMRAIRKLNIYSFCTAISTVFIAIFVTIFIKLFHLGLQGMLLGYAAGFFVGDLLVMIYTNFAKYISFKTVKFSTVKKLLRYSYSLIPNNISWWIINISDRWVINFFLGDAANGIFAIAHKIPNFCTSMFSVFNISWQETASDIVNLDTKNVYYSKVFNQMTSTLIAICAGVLCCNFIFFGGVFDIKYSSAQFYTPILITSALFGGIAQFFGGIQISMKRPKANGVTTSLAAVVNLVVHLALVKLIGLYAAAISTLLSNVFLVISRVILLRKDIKIAIDKKVYIYMAIFAYFVIFNLISTNLIISLVNLLVACCLFVYVNKDMIMKFSRRLISIVSKVK